MFRVIVFVSLFVFSDQAIIDTNCTDGTNWAAQAFNCDNVYSDSACDTLYAPANPLAVGTATDDRNDLCFTSATPDINPELKDLAIASCPKTCGYCCLTKEWNCKNAERPRIECSRVTRAMCKDATWREIIATDCPAACGFCTLGGCIDSAVDCATQPSMCFIDSFKSFVTTNCRRTCGLCTTSTTASSGTGTCASATDSSPNCASWRTNGFCTNTFYPLATRKQYCGRTCNLC